MIMIGFGNLIKFNGKSNHTWQSVMAFLKKPELVMQHLNTFDFDSVSDPTVKKIKY